MLLTIIQIYILCMVVDLVYTYYTLYTAELPEHLQSAIDSARENPSQWFVMHGSFFMANLLLSAIWPKTANDLLNRKLNQWRGI